MDCGAVFQFNGIKPYNFALTSEERAKTTLIQFNSMIIARKSYSYLKQIEKTALEEPKIMCNPIRPCNFAVRNEVTFSLMERNGLIENRVSLSIFNYHTWIEYENHTHSLRRNFCKNTVI